MQFFKKSQMDSQGKTISELCKSVGRIEGQIEGIRNELTIQNKSLSKTIENMDERIDKLEKVMSTSQKSLTALHGKLSVWAGIAGFIGSIVLIAMKWIIERF